MCTHNIMFCGKPAPPPLPPPQKEKKKKKKKNIYLDIPFI